MRASACGRGALAANSLMRRRVTSGAISPWPRATVRTAATSVSGSADLSRKPAAPARRASKTTSSRSNVVTTSTSIGAPVAGCVSSRVAAIPSIRGMRTSMRTMSAARRWASATASTPSAASPTISMSGSASRIVRSPRRTTV